MAGRGTRTQPLGEFKPFIEVKNHKIISWFLSSIKHLVQQDDILVFITTTQFANKYDFEENISQILKFHHLGNQVFFVKTQGFTSGSSETILQAKKHMDIDSPVVIINPDQYIDFDLPKKIGPKSGYLTLYLCFGNKTGFVKIEDELITSFVERKNISNIASSGVFISSSGKDLLAAINKQLDSDSPINGEFFIGSAFNYLINQGYAIKPIPIRCKYDLGNVDGINLFKNRNIECQ